MLTVSELSESMLPACYAAAILKIHVLRRRPFFILGWLHLLRSAKVALAMKRKLCVGSDQWLRNINDDSIDPLILILCDQRK